MSCKVGLIIYCILQAIAFLFILVGAPIDMFRSKSEDTFGNTPCLTLWGLKRKCYSTTYDTRPKDLFAGCKDRTTRFQAGEAFAIISIAIFLVATIFGFIQLCCCACLRWACLVFNILGVITALIPWALMAAEYNSGRGDLPLPFCIAFKTFDAYKYGAGFGLLLVGWALCLINIVFLMLPC